MKILSLFLMLRNFAFWVKEIDAPIGIQHRIATTLNYTLRTGEHFIGKTYTGLVSGMIFG